MPQLTSPRAAPCNDLLDLKKKDVTFVSLRLKHQSYLRKKAHHQTGRHRLTGGFSV